MSDKLSFYVKRRVNNEPFRDPDEGGEKWYEQHFVVDIDHADIDKKGIEDVVNEDVISPILRVETTDRFGEMQELEGDRDRFTEIPDPGDLMMLADYVIILYDNIKTKQTDMVVTKINNEELYRGQVLDGVDNPI